MIHFAHPWVLLLLLLLIPFWIYYFHYRKSGGFYFSSQALAGDLKQARLSRTVWQSYLDLFLKSFFLIAVVLVMARPQSSRSETKRKSSGLDICLLYTSDAADE